MSNAQALLDRIPEASPLLRLLVILGLILMLQIPVTMVNDLIGERRMTRHQAIEETTGKWGGEQTLAGPQMLVPVTEISPTGMMIRRELMILPKQLHAKTALDSELRHRGIYDIPLYRATIEIDGHFDFTSIPEAYSDKTIHWDRAKLLITASDPQAIQHSESMELGDRHLSLQPGTGSTLNGVRGFHAPVDIVPSQHRLPFHIELTLGGHERFNLAPVGSDSEIVITSDWPDPSFQGNWLPTKHQISESGFSAQWKIPYLGRNYPHHWIVGEGPPESEIASNTVGVTFSHALDAYGQTERSIKYDLMFIGLSFLSLWLCEVLGLFRIHPVQYLLVGSAITLFYLLLLSLAEHIGFTPAYLAATLLVVGLIVGYTRKILKRTRQAWLIGIGLSILYAYLFALLQEQEYALLAGSVGLFLILAAVMYLTRNINWDQIRLTQDSTG